MGSGGRLSDTPSDCLSNPPPPQTDIHRFQQGEMPRRGGKGEHGEILGQSLKDVKYARVPL